MITRVQVKNFRSLADVDVELGPLTVLVGRNGAGKSAFVDALRFLQDTLRVGLEDAVADRNGMTSLRRRGPGKLVDVEVSLTVQTPEMWGEYSLAIGSELHGSYRIRHERCQVGNKPTQVEESFENQNGHLSVSLSKSSFTPDEIGQNIEPTTLVLPSIALYSPLFANMRRALRGNFYNIPPNTLRAPQKPSENRVLVESGDNFASVLQRLIAENRWMCDLVTALGKVVDGVSDVRVMDVGGYLVTQLKHDDIAASTDRSVNLPWFDLAQESDGALRMLGMLVALYQQESPGALLALEEPEIALHPGALAILSDIIQEASHRQQVLITTQSPDLISRFNVDELRVVERSNGITQIGLIDDMQREALEEQLFSAGDLLRIEGLRREATSVD
jgi:predicted ATPase